MMSHSSSGHSRYPGVDPNNPYLRAKEGDVGPYEHPAPPQKATQTPQKTAQSNKERGDVTAPVVPSTTRSSFEHFQTFLAVEKEEFLADKDVAQRYRVTKQTIWRWQKANPNFPNPIKINGASRWRLSELIAYEFAELGYSSDQRCA